MSIIDPGFYDRWQADFYAASIAIDNRDRRLADVADKIEINLRLLGATAIEDKLQDVCEITYLEGHIELLKLFWKLLDDPKICNVFQKI